MHKRSSDKLVSQILSTVELESSLALYVSLSDHRVKAVEFVNSRLARSLKEVCRMIQASGKSDTKVTRKMLRRAMIPQINAVATELIERALMGFVGMETAPVQYLINTENRGVRPTYSEFNFRDFPFICYQDESLRAVQFIRTQPPSLQFDVLKALRARNQAANFDVDEYLNENQTYQPEYIRWKLSIEALLEDAKHRFSDELQSASDDFYAGLEVGSVHPYAAPIVLSVSMPIDDQRIVADAYRDFGRALKVGFELAYRGPRDSVDRAKAAQLQYESAGSGLCILSAWIRSLELLESERFCSICFRHASAISRCSFHATKDYEKPSARRDKRVKPIYERILRGYLRNSAVRNSIRAAQAVDESTYASWQHAARKIGLDTASRFAFVDLARQLYEYRALMSTSMQEEARALFASIIQIDLQNTVQQDSSVQFSGLREKQRLQALKELKSIKGFFRAWFGKGRYAEDVWLQMREHDPKHPVADGGAFDADQISKALIRQRAWEDAQSKFLLMTAPTSQDIKQCLNSGMTKQEAAKTLNIGLSTVYKILKHGEQPRKRQFLGHA